MKYYNNIPVFNHDGKQGDPSSASIKRSIGIIQWNNTDLFIGFTLQNDPSKLVYLAGGKIELAETGLEAAQREIAEEIGLTNLIYKADLGICHKFVEYPDGLAHNLEHYYLFECSQLSWDNRQKSEIDEKGGKVVIISEDRLRQNNWNQLNWILDNLKLCKYC